MSEPENTGMVFVFNPFAFNASVTSFALTTDAFLLPFASVTSLASDAGSGSVLPPHTSLRYVKNATRPPTTTNTASTIARTNAGRRFFATVRAPSPPSPGSVPPGATGGNAAVAAD